jgi:DNA-binding GntR family transcriptional regulator
MAETAAIGYRTKADAAYTELRRRIIAGVLAPSAHLNQEQLASLLGVSTTPLREALRRLESEGFIITTAHRDVVVAPLDLDQMIFLYEVKEALECAAAALAAERRTGDDRTAITAALDRLGKNHSASEDEEAWAANRGLHAAIYRASHNPVLIEELDQVWDRYERFRRVLDVLVLAPSIDQEHASIVAAVFRGDAREAAEAMRAHLRRAQKLIEAEMDKRAAVVGSAASAVVHG